MRRAAGLDLGGTKCAVQIFDDRWTCIDERRDPTPKSYDELLALIEDQFAWAGDIPVGISAAGRVKADGRVLAANLCSNENALPSDLRRVLGADIAYLNDGHALALSEALFGAGKGLERVAAVVLGTGVGGGFVVRERLTLGPSGLQGEYGHTALPALVAQQYDLPVLDCSCGRRGCVETILAGDFGVDAKLAVLSELLHTLTMTLDPDVIVLAGGGSKQPNLLNALAPYREGASLKGFSLPPVKLATGGDASGARGAAYVAWQAHND